MRRTHFRTEDTPAGGDLLRPTRAETRQAGILLRLVEQTEPKPTMRRTHFRTEDTPSSGDLLRPTRAEVRQADMLKSKEGGKEGGN